MATTADTIFSLQFIVYVAGVYIPASSVSVTSAFNNIPTCTIALPAYPKELYGIGRSDRVPVHVFYFDNFATEPPTYKLFFEGVITGFGYVNNSLGRAFILNCEHIFNILQRIKIRHVSDIKQWASSRLPGQALTAFTRMAMPSLFPLLMFMKAEGSLVEYPTQILDNAFDYIMSNAGADPLTKFYKEYLTALKADHRFQRVAYFDQGKDVWGTDTLPTLSFLETKAASEAIAKAVGVWGREASLWELINGVLSKMEYEIGVYNSPSYFTTDLISLCLKPLLYDGFPPKCNILFRSHVISVTTNENVSDIPTRIVARDFHNIMYKLFQGGNPILQELMIMDCYPSEIYNSEKIPDEYNDPYVQELLKAEDYTGPVVHDIPAPDWWSYVNPAKIFSNDPAVAKKQYYTARTQMLKSMYLKDRYQGSRMSVTMAFNPYVVSGFPGVVFEPEDGTCAFIGHILAVQHDLNKSGGTTTIEFSFVRTLEQEKTNRLENSMKLISDVVTNNADIGRMTDVYQSIIACDAITIKDADNLLSDTEEQKNPWKAYQYNKREIVTMDEYCTFMGFTAEDEVTIEDDYHNKIPGSLSGKFLTNRNTSYKDYIDTLKNDVQAPEIKREIYNVK
jgi:hypothetical protein